MIPMALIFVAGYLAITRCPSPRGSVHDRQHRRSPPRGGVGRLASPTYALRSLAASARSGSRSSVRLRWPSPPPTLSPTRSSPRPSTASPAVTTSPAAPFHLVDQNGKDRVSLQSLRGKVVALTFLDPGLHDGLSDSSPRSSARPIGCSGRLALGRTSSPSSRTRSTAPSRRHVRFTSHRGAWRPR